ncbi:helix-turn-helix domain-containing protein, partial [Desulfobacula sp.]|uniref:helix-turn-helix domain-containing protein n=1 Tax=Desulfobacula sp. TaxID=2593537 RepID=UPI0039B911A6|nr:sigma-54-dependent Fis family transcriptional regulator [Desulfobacula sp.]
EQESPNIVPQLADDALDIMLDYHWPGNVRELKNAIQFSVVRSRGSRILPSDLPMEIIQDIDLSLRVSDRPRAQQIISPKGKLDIESVKAAIKKTGGNKSKAARVLGVGRATLYRFLAQNEETKNYVDQF